MVSRPWRPVLHREKHVDEGRAASGRTGLPIEAPRRPDGRALGLARFERGEEGFAIGRAAAAEHPVRANEEGLVHRTGASTADS